MAKENQTSTFVAILFTFLIFYSYLINSDLGIFFAGLLLAILTFKKGLSSPNGKLEEVFNLKKTIRMPKSFSQKCELWITISSILILNSDIEITLVSSDQFSFLSYNLPTIAFGLLTSLLFGWLLHRFIVFDLLKDLDAR